MIFNVLQEDILSFSKKVDVSDCLICDEKIAEVLFEPCKHVVCCSGKEKILCCECNAICQQVDHRVFLECRITFSQSNVYIL